MNPTLFNFTDIELEQFVTDLGQPRFRAKQIREWLDRGAPNFSVMKNLPESLRIQLDKVARTLPVKITNKLESTDGATVKFLLELDDGNQIETVLMRTTYGASVCVSSQAGCAMGCKFCASTLLGLRRNLTAHEMLAQVLIAQWQLKQSENASNLNSRLSNFNSDNYTHDEVTHIVVMGTGEPLYNIENLIEFIERAHKNLKIGWRRITISTCGVVPGIQRLTEWGRPVNLAISLHAPNDTMREQIMPINKRYNISDVLTTAFENADKNNRQLMIEYILLAAAPQEESAKCKVQSSDENSLKSKLSNLNSLFYNYTDECAVELSNLLAGKNCMVNLIPWNAVDEREFIAPSGNATHRFQDILIKNGVHTRIRRERGTDIGSACGQLRLKTGGKNDV